MEQTQSSVSASDAMLMARNVLKLRDSLLEQPLPEAISPEWLEYAHSRITRDIFDTAATRPGFALNNQSLPLVCQEINGALGTIRAGADRDIGSNRIASATARTFAVAPFNVANELVSEVLVDHFAMLGGQKVQWAQMDKAHLDAAREKAASGNVGALKNMLQENMVPLYPAPKKCQP